jgi:hypothetical protein
MPGRIDSGLARSMASTEPLPLLMRPGLDWLRGLRNNWEAVTHRWNVWVLGYNPDRQRDLLGFVGMRDADWRKLTAVLFVILGLITAALVVITLRNRSRPDPVERAWQRFCDMLSTRGLARLPHEGPRDYSRRASRKMPASGDLIEQIGDRYLELRYGAGTDEVERRSFVQLVRRFRAAG